MTSFSQNTFDVANRSAKLIYRDLIKIVKKTMPIIKHNIVLSMIRKEFESNKYISNPKDVDQLKRNAGKAIADLSVYYIKEDYKNKKFNNTATSKLDN